MFNVDRVMRSWNRKYDKKIVRVMRYITPKSLNDIAIKFAEDSPRCKMKPLHRVQVILRRRQGETYQSIADGLGCHRERARQLERFMFSTVERIYNSKIPQYRNMIKVKEDIHV